MKKAITILTVSALTLAMSATLFAQGAGPKGGGVGAGFGQGQKGPGGHGRGGMMMMHNKKMQQEVYSQLGLSADQKKRLEALQKSTMEKMKALRDKAAGTTDKQALRGQARPIIEAYQKGLKDILTPAQEQKLQELMKAAREKMRKEHPGGFGRPGSPPPPPKGGGGN